MPPKITFTDTLAMALCTLLLAGACAVMAYQWQRAFDAPVCHYLGVGRNQDTDPRCHTAGDVEEE